MSDQELALKMPSKRHWSDHKKYIIDNGAYQFGFRDHCISERRASMKGEDNVVRWIGR